MANQISGLSQKVIKNPKIMQIAKQMFNSLSQQGQDSFLDNNLVDKLPEGFGHIPGSSFYVKNPAEFSEDYVGPILAHNNEGQFIPENFGSLNAGEGITGSQLGSLALGAAKAHPFKTAGLIGMGAGNIGGLTDNDKFGGQLAGLGLGGLGAHLLAQGNPYLQAVMTMGGGNIGALFDKLRARREMERAQGIPNAGNPIAMLGR